MTPIERFRQTIKSARDARFGGSSKDGWSISMTPQFAEALLAAYDARGEYVALLEQNQKDCAHHTGHISDRDRATCTRLGCRLHQAKKDTDSAVARVEGEV